MWTYHFNDALGSLRQITGAEADVLFAQSYEPYGKVYESSGTGASNYGFSGELTDPGELVYLRARYYQPETGRFISRDTWGGNVYNPQSLNRWSYAAANPVVFVDPSGRMRMDEDGTSQGDTGKYRYYDPIPEYDDGVDNVDDLREAESKIQPALIYYEFTGEVVPPGTFQSQYKIKSNNGNLCLLVAAASRISRIIGRRISANELYEWYLKYDPNYINAIDGIDQQLEGRDLVAFIKSNEYLNENLFVKTNNSGALFGKRGSSSPNDIDTIIQNVKKSLEKWRRNYCWGGLSSFKR